jgi:aspartate-semialdehyde dehydrogenase
VRIGIVGATGIVGQELTEILADSSVKVSELRLSASTGSVGKRVVTHLGEQRIANLDEEFFADLDFCFFCVSSELSRKWVPVAAARGAVCIDNSSAFRMERDVPIVVPEVNGDLLKTRPRVIANPNCCVAQLVVALGPIDEAFGLDELSVCTYQSVSGAGQKAISQLDAEVASAALKNEPRQFLFNVIPNIGPCDSRGIYQEERKIVEETRKILDLPRLPIAVTAARVPVYRGHCEAVSFVVKRLASAAQIKNRLINAPNILVIHDNVKDLHPQPVSIQYTNQVYVGRIRENSYHRENSYSMWVVADNLRKGAAHNALSIAEKWCE